MIKKFLGKLTYKVGRFVWVHSFGCSSPQLSDALTMVLWQAAQLSGNAWQN